jgi:hypothetical protein
MEKTLAIAKEETSREDSNFKLVEKGTISNNNKAK